MPTEFQIEGMWEKWTYNSITTFVQGYEEDKMIEVLQRTPAWKRANALWTALEVIRILEKAGYAPASQTASKITIDFYQTQLVKRMKEPPNAEI